MYVIREKFNPAGYGLVLQNRSPLMKEFNENIKWILYYGLNDYWLDKNIQEVQGNNLMRGQTLSAIEDDDSPITLHHLEGAFVALGAGFILSIILFISEIII